ncbi:MAG: NUDIX domain-containing protein, partial [Wujia sp.]
MEFKGIKKKEEGKFIACYDVEYETVDGQQKIYEMISRDRDIQTFEQLHGKRADAVVIIATDEKDERILIDREFRLAPGEWVYNFPAGLIDPGETPEVSAKR